jgi:dolichol-phosphate mannosyltransferase
VRPALVVVPTFNERDNLPILIDGLLRIPSLSVLVVDDGSPDGTGNVADALAKAHSGRITVLHRHGKRGLGLSYIDGLGRALATGIPVICQMDADLSHDPAELPLCERCERLPGQRAPKVQSVLDGHVHVMQVRHVPNRDQC